MIYLARPAHAPDSIYFFRSHAKSRFDCWMKCWRGRGPEWAVSARCRSLPNAPERYRASRVVAHPTTYKHSFTGHSAARRRPFFDCPKKPSHIVLKTWNRSWFWRATASLGVCRWVIRCVCGLRVSARVWSCYLGTGNPWANIAPRLAPCPPPSRQRTATMTAC